MSLIVSISGIRGTVGGVPEENFTPLDVFRFSYAYASWILKNNSDNPHIVIGRDARISGLMVSQIVTGTLLSMGIKVTDLGLSTTPTVEIAVPEENADGGIIITASHNPKEWNALKLLNRKGEFISSADGEWIKEEVGKNNYCFSGIDKIGSYRQDNSYIRKHIDKILQLPLVDIESIKKKNFKVVIDCVNSTGGIALPELLQRLGVSEVVELYCTPDGKFPHNPEPLPQNLFAIASEVKLNKAHLGIVVDPDVDRLLFICEDGDFFGEEYTLVAVADYVLKNTPGNTVSNLSSTRALRDVTQKHGCQYFASAVGEVNVVEMMKQNNAIIGGEGNGGIIYPELHYGRDAMVGIALFLSHLAKSNKTASTLRASYPQYFMSKSKIELTPEIDIDHLITCMKEKYKNQPQNSIDGLKIEFENEWVHLRKSNTEPIIRIYTESQSQATSDFLANKIISDINSFI